MHYTQQKGIKETTKLLKPSPSTVEAKLMEEDKAKYGNNYILFPNPTDGHWMRAIFGDSEPPPSDANRETFKKAATRQAWDGK